MKLVDAPDKIVLPFADSGTKVTIPVPSQIAITPGAASFTDGFPPLTLTPTSGGGIPPFGQDMNGILFDATALNRWNNAGAGFVYDGTFATDTNIGGYPAGARILRTDGLGYWLNTVDDNIVDPESSGSAAAGWVPDYTNGISAVTMTSSNVTLTALQYGLPIISLSGLLTTNLNLIFPAIPFEWVIINNCTGAYTITAKTASGSGISVGATGSTSIYGDGVNIYISFYGLPISGGTMTGALNTASATAIASAGTINLTTATGNYAHITGTTTITGITLQAGAERAVIFDGALTLTNGSSLKLPGGANIVTAAGDSAIFYGDAAGVVRCVSYFYATAQTWQDVSGSRAKNTTYTNSTGRPIQVNVSCSISVNGSYSMTVGSVLVVSGNGYSGTSGTSVTLASAIVPAGSTYIVQCSGSISAWAELR
jgi:hypothetical protein